MFPANPLEGYTGRRPGERPVVSPEPVPARSPPGRSLGYPAYGQDEILESYVL